ncbi:tryptophan 2,3-dioxygenase [Peterkaempfera bronchialis]|uniref:Tryptophan 2,3-dioxygenase n=1 Tax=Peterkaempfera bronchialis TaxID=2126346 RepID=A0A345T4J9_9ACTN|nr:hypothetical protein [Peterkaempfera bronchialis]AXI80904.1 hypothetical protein C7M71_029510 [Peterkaempfera bronchialis]
MSTAVRSAPQTIRDWSRAVDGIGPGSPAPAFPFAEATAAVRAHGTAELPAELAEALVDAARTARTRAGEPPDESWFTDRWLRSATMTATATQSYEAYTMCGLFEQYCRSGPAGYQQHARLLSAALTADLIRHELDAAPSDRPDARTAAATRLTGDLCQAIRPGGAPPRPLGHDAALRLCTRLIHRLCRTQPPVLRRIVDCTPLPATTEPDEYLFTRSVQIMEVLSAVAAEQAGEARNRGPHQPSGLPPRLHALADTLRHATRLFHLLCTLDAGQFAHIRDATYGTGALQSPAFAALERCCRGEQALRPETLEAVPLDRSPLPEIPLRQALAALRTRLDPEAAARLDEAVTAVDTAWVRWKRTHRGVARRIIGDVPGTGGTDGLSYLNRHLDTPLLTHHD